MMENNVFRVYMLIGGLMVTGLAMACLYLYPVKPVPPDTKVAYERVMNETFPADRIITTTGDPNKGGVSLTTYEMLSFYLKGTVRGNTRHY